MTDDITRTELTRDMLSELFGFKVDDLQWDYIQRYWTYMSVGAGQEPDVNRRTDADLMEVVRHVAGIPLPTVHDHITTSMPRHIIEKAVSALGRRTDEPEEDHRWANMMRGGGYQ